MPHSVAHHLQLDADKIRYAKIALLPGDPFRVPLIAQHLNDSKEVSHQREFCSYLGTLGDEPVLVTSTGCGGPSVSVCVEELAQIGVRTFIRVGSTGALQEHINITDVVISNGAVRLDGASRSFAPIEYPAISNLDVTNALVAGATNCGIKYHVGITASTDTFYQGQERYDTYSGFVPAHLRGTLKDWQQMNVLNYEMEAATLFTMCSVLKLRAGAVCGVVANRVVGELVVSKDEFIIGEQNAIKTAIGAVRQLLLKNE